MHVFADVKFAPLSAGLVVAFVGLFTRAATFVPLSAPIADTLAALQANEFIAYSPGHGWSPGTTLSKQDIEADLMLLRATGRQGIITFDMHHGLDQVPEVAKSLGFRYVIVGIKDPGTDMNLINGNNAHWIDGILVGNEGICRGLNECGNASPTWTASQLVQWIAAARQNWPGKVVLTSEAWTMYHDDPNNPNDGFAPELLTLEGGDLVFPNLHPQWEPTKQVEYCPEIGVEFVENVINQNILPGNPEMPIVLHESWWPSAPTDNTCENVMGCSGSPNGYNEGAQSRYFSLLASSGVSFVWGEAYDQPWKNGEGSNACGAALGPNWGLWRNDGTPKQVVAAVLNRMIFADGFESGNSSSWSWTTP